jgi:ABC-type branched-subunit amino acid transport system ATPase component
VLLSVKDLSVHFDGVRACDGIDLSVDQGEIVGIVGPNGSGKTTLFRAVCGDVDVAGGRIEWQGLDITGWPTDRIARHGLVRTFQQSMVFASTTVRENLRMAQACAREDHARAGQLPHALEEVLVFTGLAASADTQAGALPTGTLRLVGIALALMTRPALLMLDEPAAGLNVEEAARLREVLERVNAAGVAVAVVDHDMSFILPLCQRLVVLDTGKKLVEGEPYAICQHPEVVRVYLGGRFAGGKAGDNADTGG